MPHPQSDNASEHLNPLRSFNLRVGLLKIFFAAFFALLASRLVQVQIVDAEKYERLARRQYESRVTLPAARGKIYDRHGNVLVSNASFVSFGADPEMVRKASAVAEEFARVFHRPKSQYLEKLLSGGRFVWLERRVSPSAGTTVRTDKIPGVIRLEEPKRLYHYGDVGGPLIGFTDIDNRGLSGIELEYERVLRGSDGYAIMQRDGLGRTLPSMDYPRVEPVDGHDVLLTVDLAYQSIAEEELRKGIAYHQAKSGLALIMNPKSAEILALAQWPAVNPNEFYRFDASAQKIRAVTDMFEPGSLFKVVTATAALKEHLVTPNQKFFAENGKYVVSVRGRTLRTIRDAHEFGWITFTEAMEHSSNIVMAKVSDLIGADRLYACARDFGFGSPTNIDLPGEVGGKLKKPSEWSGTTLNTMAYGYEIAATPLQIAAAYCAVANGGALLKPRVLKRVVSNGDPADREELEAETGFIRNVASSEVTRMLTDLFVGVVDEGTGVLTRIDGVRIAGKTGTSRKYADGNYESGSYTSSFVGYFPADDPEFLCLVMLDNPRAVGYFGGETAGPVFRAIAERCINTGADQLRDVVRRSTGEAADRATMVPDVRNLKVDVASAVLERRGFSVDLLGHGEIVVEQIPGPGKQVDQASLVRLVTAQYGDGVNPEDGLISVPDLRGTTIRRAVNRLTLDNLVAMVSGSGIVVGQSPAPGVRVKERSRVELLCQPKAAARPNPVAEQTVQHRTPDRD